MTPFPGISIRKGVCGGEPCVAGTRVPTRVIWATFLYGVSVQTMTHYWPTVTAEQIENALRYEMRGRKRRLGT